MEIFKGVCRIAETDIDHSAASERILEWGRRGEARRAESGGWGSWGGDSHPSPPTRGFAGAISSLSGVQSGAPRSPKGFLVF